jgi:hypothetical protein
MWGYVGPAVVPYDTMGDIRPVRLPRRLTWLMQEGITREAGRRVANTSQNEFFGGKTMQRRDDIDARQTEVLDYLERHTYDETAGRFGTSKSKVYTLTIEAKRRKHEARITVQAKERECRQIEFLQSIVKSVMTTDVLDFRR